jgi:hypothetical protein
MARAARTAPVGIDGNDLFTFSLSCAPCALEAEHHVLGGERVAVVEFEALGKVNSQTSRSGLSVQDS